MNQIDEILEFGRIKEMLVERAVTRVAKERLLKLAPILNEAVLRQAMKETTEAVKILNVCKNPHLVDAEEIKGMLVIAEKEGMLHPRQLEKIAAFTSSSRRLKAYLKNAERTQMQLAFCGQQIEGLDKIFDEINRCIRGSEIDDHASKLLVSIRNQQAKIRSEIQTKLEGQLKAKKAWFTDCFISMKNGHYTLPVKKEYKHQVAGSIITISGTGETCFIEPVAVIKLTEQSEQLRYEEEAEIGRILYELTALVYEYRYEIIKNIEIMEALDFIFAKGKLSIFMDAREPEVVMERVIRITKGRHPLIEKEVCVPIDFSMGEELRGIIITGPNTGGKTVTLKLVGLFSVMAQSGLHLPCEEAKLCMHSNVLCEIGDGQSIDQNLSTFSAHITNTIAILQRTQRDSLVLLDEVGSGTDPEEGMGLAIAILERLRQKGCLFVATTHYVEVKTYAHETEHLSNARMTFDQDTLKPLYQLVIGEAGESCAFDIAKRLGFPEELLAFAKSIVCGEHRALESKSEKPCNLPRLVATEKKRVLCKHAASFGMGDSVMVYPQHVIGVVYRPSNEHGDLIVQVQGKKRKINHKRIKLIAPASQLYPEGYDFSIIFNSVTHRKISHQMERKYSPGLELVHDSESFEPSGPTSI